MITQKEPTPQEIRSAGIYRSFGLNDSEYEHIVELLGREPNYVETGIFSVMWSEHCSYKSSRAQFKKFPTSGPRVMQGPGENAGIVDIGDGYAVAFKMESHNHPSAIEPYQGAATGVGGIIRDIFTMGARPIALLNSLRFGSLHDHPRNKYLFENVVKGIAGYGNCIGIPTVGGEVVFDDRYTQNPLVNAMCVGLLRHDQIATGSAKGVSNPVMVVGAKTGRDGIHGATFASAEDPYSKERSAVQVGDPFMEKLLLEACLELIATGAVVGIQDMGAAGLTSSSSEMAARAGSGIELDMLLVPRREEGMTPYEIMLSESQERMLVVMKKGQEEIAERIFKKWGLDAVVIGRVTDDGCLRILEGSRVCAEIPVTHLVDEAPVYHRPSVRPQELDQLQAYDPLATPEPVNYSEILQALIKRPTIASKEWVYRQYDSMVRTSTAVKPGSDAAVVVVRGTEKAIAMSTDGNGRYVFLDPYVGGQLAVAEAARNVVCSGAEPIAITDCLNFGSPEKPEIYYQFEKAIDGISEACRALETPVISGNVSFYNQTGGIDIYPTPIIGMVGLVSDQAHVTTQSFKQEGNLIFMTGATGNDLGGSEYVAAFQGATAGKPPELDLDLEVRVQKFVLAAIRAKLAQAAHDCSDGGLAVALAESCIGGNLGAVVHLEGELRKDVQLFAETPSRVLIEVKEEHQGLFEALAQECQVPISLLGQVEGDSLVIAVNEEIVIDAEVEELSKSWKGALSCEME